MKEQLVSLSKYIRPERFDVKPDSNNAEIKFKHWKTLFTNFLSLQTDESTPETVKLMILTNHLDADIFAFIQECKTYLSGINLLEKIYIKPKNTVYARHILATRLQKQGESVSEFAQTLKNLAIDCSFESVNAEDHKNQFIRDAFITGLDSNEIRRRLLENTNLTFEEALNQAFTYENAETNAKSYINSKQIFSAAQTASTSNSIEHKTPSTSSSAAKRKYCWFCGALGLHQRIKCPAFHSLCGKCGKRGHFSKVCRSEPSANAICEPLLVESSGTCAASPASLQQATIPISINQVRADALIDTGSSLSFISKNIAQFLNLSRKPCHQTITLASIGNTSVADGICFPTIEMGGYVYKRVPLLIIENLCADVIIGHDLLRKHSYIEMNFGGNQKPLKICNVLAANVPPASIFHDLSTAIKPIAIKSRRFNSEDEEFIKQEIDKLLEDGVIEPSISPWRAQVLVAGGGQHRKRMVIDYSLTINKFTQLDAYPLPYIETIVSKVAKHNFFSQIDLKSAYHQVSILESEKKYTAFEACGKLYQFTRIPFGVTNGVAAFQRTLQYIISKESLTGTYAYLDDVTVCGNTQEDHDKNLERFMQAVQKYKLTLNRDKCIFSKQSIKLLGYQIQNNTIKPDEDRLTPLINLPVPTDMPSLKRVLGLFAHYSKWIKNFSEKIHPMVAVAKFPMNNEAIACFEELKSAISKSVLTSALENVQFTVETDASDHALAATLSQNGRPVAFFSRALTDPERRHPAIEKEAAAIVEALRKWRHFLLGRHFILITDQQSVSFMFNQNHTSKIKNEKIERWRLELSCYKYDVVYRPGRENTVADAFSRVCANASPNKLYELHDAIGHPGIVRMNHWIRMKNLPYSADQIKTMIQNCRVCAEIKPRFATTKGNLIKATAPFERLNIDFKGPLPSSTQNKYILTVIDEFSRFPFAFPCKDLTSNTVITCLKEIFMMFGAPQYIHSDRGASFMSSELRDFLVSLGIACSRTTPYNPQCNGQVERLNGTLWKTIKLYLRSKDMPVGQWEQVIPHALHSIRSLLCTSTNMTPHERMFKHPRRSATGDTVPSWLLCPGPVLLKKHVRHSKYDPLVEEAELIEANPLYSFIRLQNGTETTVSNRHLAPLPDEDNFEDADDQPILIDPPSTPLPPDLPDLPTNSPSLSPRRSSRERRAPQYLSDYVTTMMSL